ncbi:hypothetical protein LJR084_006970 [Variovorax sp. LjRoot84]
MSAPLRPPPSDLHGINLETVQFSIASRYRISNMTRAQEPIWPRAKAASGLGALTSAVIEEDFSNAYSHRKCEHGGTRLA